MTMDYIPLTTQNLAALVLGVFFTALPGLAAAALAHFYDQSGDGLEAAVIDELIGR